MRTSVEQSLSMQAVALAAAVIAVPKAVTANSFVLHSPLELMARVGLLPSVAPGRLDEAIGMIDGLAARYAAAGDPVTVPAPVGFRSAQHGARMLVDAIGNGDVDFVDAIAGALLPTLSAHEAAGLLGESVVTSLAAAGHAPIGFALLARVQSKLPVDLLRGAVRSLTMRPEWQIRWHLGDDSPGDAARLYAALRETPRLGCPGDGFIHPIMSQVQDAGIAARLLTPVLCDRYDVVAASRTLTRVAAWSMLHDDPAASPYGWTHAFTMPQAVMALAGAGVHPRTALAVAGTFMVGFRAAHGLVDLPEVIEPGAAPDATVEELATAGALHDDAHVAKFTLACLHAVVDDPTFRPLYLGAVDHLLRWWQG